MARLLVAIALMAATPAAPSDQQTHPRVHPGKGTRHTTFALRFTLRSEPGHEGTVAKTYRFTVAPPKGARARCTPPAPHPVTKGDVGDRRRVVLPPPSRGWCRGRHRVTVLLETGPYCPPPDPGGQPAPCPKFATQVVDAGHARFRVRRR